MEGQELPVGWSTSTGSEIFELVTSGSRGWAKYYSDDGPLFIRIGNLDHGSVELDLKAVQRVTLPNDSEGKRTRLEPNDILISITAELGMIALVPDDLGEAYVNQHVALARPVPEIAARFLAWYLASESDGKKQLLELKRGATKVGLGLPDIRNLILPLAPLNEQRRIAAKLDTTLAAVEACRHRLDGEAAILKRFRQAVLAAATSGELTREWREERGLADSWKTKDLSEIADSRLGKMLDQSKNTGELTPYLRNINVRWFSFDLEDIQEIRLADTEIIDLDVRFGDLLVCEGGEPGRCAVWRGEDSKYTFQKALHRVRTSKHLLADYLSFCLSNSANNGKLEQLFTGTTIKHLTGASLKKFQILLPSREEQEEIVDRVETFFTLADQLEARLTAARKVVDRLTPALLAKAFRGELVPQDPNDEPASVLLERIRAARQAEAGAGKSSRRGRKKAAANPAPRPVDAAPVTPDRLATLLRECGALSERALMAASELDPASFQAQLTHERSLDTIGNAYDDGQELLEAVG
jgi:type I restriction enzyme S subunit